MKIFKIENRGLDKIITFLGIKVKLPNKIKILQENTTSIRLEIDTLRNNLNSLKENLNYFIDIKQAPNAKGQLRQIQLLDLFLMKELKKICDELGIKFWLRGGSALGAYRHNGFIPWDDDTDLGMMRDDFDKLMHWMNANCNDYEITYYYHFDCKVAKFKFKNSKAPVFLDIFPFDWCTWDNHNEFWAKWRQDKEELVSKLSTVRFKEGYASTLTYEQIDKIESYNDLYKEKWLKIKGKTAIYSSIEQIYLQDLKVFPVEMIFPLQLTKFEDTEFYTVNQVENYLKFYFGDYMNFPPYINTRTHRFMFSDKDYEEISVLYSKYFEKEI